MTDIIKEYNDACTKHGCNLGKIISQDCYGSEIYINSEFYAIGRCKDDNGIVYRGYVKDMDQLFHDAFVDEDKSTFSSIEEVVVALGAIDQRSKHHAGLDQGQITTLVEDDASSES